MQSPLVPPADFITTAPSGQTLNVFVSGGEAVVALPVHVIGGSFGRSRSLVIPPAVSCNGRTYRVTGLGDRAFRGFSHIVSVQLPDTLTAIGHLAFLGCYDIVEIDIPDGVVSIGNGAFSYCSCLKRLTLGSSVCQLGAGAFNYCSRLTQITSKAKEAPLLDERVFNHVGGDIPIYIPSGSLSSYCERWGKSFANFEEL